MVARQRGCVSSSKRVEEASSSNDIANRPNMNEPAIFVTALTALRRGAIQKLLSATWPHARIVVSSAFSSEKMQQDEAEILVADLESSVQAEAMLRFLLSVPPLGGSVALIDDPDPMWVRRALAAGVNAIIAGDSDSDDLRLAVDAANSGFVLLHPSSARQLVLPLEEAEAVALNREDFSVEHLTAREREVLRLMSTGLGNKDIAVRLGISEHTVKFHASSILGKLGASSRTEAVSQGIRRGVIPL